MGVERTQTRVRYLVLAFGVCLAAITYLDRVCISITAQQMMQDLHLSPVQMSLVFSAFTLAYALFEIPTGWWGDRVGTRKVLTRIVVWWSSFTIATAASFSYHSLLAVRFLFGAGEAGAWPNIARTFSRWFPATERGTAQGIFFMGAHLAGGITPLLVAAMLQVMHWRMVFVVFGAIGFVWAFAWYRWFRDNPEDHPAVSESEVALISKGRAPAAGHDLDRRRWKILLSDRNLWLLCTMYFAQCYGFYFYITWLPSYLEKVRGFSSATLGVMAGLPLMLSVLADLFGGVTTDRAVRRFGLRIGRAGVGAASFFAASIAMIAGTAVSDPVVSGICIALAAASSNFALGAAWGCCIDIGGSHSGVVSACMNTAGQVGGVLSPIILAQVVQHSSDWMAPLYLTGVLYLMGAICWSFVNPNRPIWDESHEKSSVRAVTY
jgi:Nitrate/nitrite transporter